MLPQSPCVALFVHDDSRHVEYMVDDMYARDELSKALELDNLLVYDERRFVRFSCK
jgi:hypothetical protein